MLSDWIFPLEPNSCILFFMLWLYARVIVMVAIDLPLCPNALRESWNGRLITSENERLVASVCNTLCTGVVILTLRLKCCPLLLSAMLLIRCMTSGNLKDNLVLILSLLSLISLRDQFTSIPLLHQAVCTDYLSWHHTPVMESVCP
jgi:hypothetical protein